MFITRNFTSLTFLTLVYIILIKTFFMIKTDPEGPKTTANSYVSVFRETLSLSESYQTDFCSDLAGHSHDSGYKT